MEVRDTAIEGPKIIVPRIFRDGRGYFCETYNAARYRAVGIDAVFAQDNESLSSKGVIRGLHWQAAPHAQAKLVRVIRGAVWDVAVDIRRGSPTFGRHIAMELSAANGLQLYIPHGFAHGFVVLEDDTLFSYKCDALYCPASERGIRFDDPALGIALPDLGVSLIRSERDRRLPLLSEIDPWQAD